MPKKYNNHKVLTMMDLTMLKENIYMHCMITLVIDMNCWNM